MHILNGRVGGTLAGYDISLETDGIYTSGRIGGMTQGGDVSLEHTGGRVSGRIGGSLLGFDVVGQLEPDRIEVRLGGEVMGDDLHLQRIGTVFTGRFSGQVSGKDVRLEVILEPTPSNQNVRLEGRIGGVNIGKDVWVAGDFPLELAALVAGISYKLLEDAESTASSGSS